MHLNFRNVNTAFHELVKGIHTGSITTSKKSTRNGFVFQVDEPMLITYSHPKERVLFNQERDANPFFMLYEALWMLAGRNDVGSVAYYAKQMREYSDDGKTLNGAYGYRWRHSQENQNSPFEKEHDQIQLIIDHLRADQNSRRAVLQMWNVEDDLLKIGLKDTGKVADGFLASDKPGFHPVTVPASKDVCCNLSVMFSLREKDYIKTIGGGFAMEAAVGNWVLDMTVTNRSNDMIWGMLGANYVHFTFLQEYIAGCLGVEVGRYHHFTNNLHVYDWNWKPDDWLKEPQQFGFHDSNGDDWGGQYKTWKTIPLVKDQATFDREVVEFVDKFNGKRSVGVYPKTSSMNWQEPFLRGVAEPMLMAFQFYKERVKNVEWNLIAEEWCKEIQADDWRIACTNWIKRRSGNG